MNTFEELRAKAASVELAGVNFFAKDGTLARKRRAIHHAEFTFIDGVRLVLPQAEVNHPEFDALKFQLRPTQNHS